MNQSTNQILDRLLNGLGFGLELTRDGSPTLRLKNTTDDQGTAESMHHSGGAASETWYIYGSVMEKVFQNAERLQISPIKTCCVGLGLGFIEMAYALNALNQKINGQIDSFEIVAGLVKNFKHWILKNENSTGEIYDLAFCKLVETNQKFINTPKSAVQDYLKSQLEKNFLIHGDLLTYSETKKWHLVCFDAFSKKSSEAIWTDQFLNQFIEKHCEDNCVFTTYACTSELKRILKIHGFTILKRPGFSGKRESTLAVRGCFSLDSSFQTF